jgi:hypothetical protein
LKGKDNFEYALTAELDMMKEEKALEGKLEGAMAKNAVRNIITTIGNPLKKGEK